MAGCAAEAGPEEGGWDAPGFETVTGALSVAPMACAEPSVGPARGLWLWSPTPMLTSTERAKFFDFAKARGVRTVYVAAGNYMTYKTEYINAFTKEAADDCIQVEILFGKASWALTAGHAEPVALLKAAIATIKLMEVKPVGVHFDVEPHLLSGWSTNMGSYANQYLDLLNKLRPIANAAGLRLTVDIPFWYDGKMVTRNGVSRPLSELTQDRTDRVALMDYRDTASAIYTEAAKEVAYAKSKGKDVVIGVETMCNVSPSYITFCQEGKTAIDTAFRTVKDKFAGSSGLGGFAVHHYGTYSAL